MVARVNLIPAIYARRAAVRTAKLAAVAAVMGALLVVALLWLVSWQKAASAQEDLDAATFERTMLQTESARYSEVPKVFDRVALAEDQLQFAMGNEVRWSFFLNDLALAMPAGVGLETLDVSVIGPAQPPTSPTVGGPATKLGTLNVSAKALAYNNVANWLDSLAKLDTLSNPAVASLASAKDEQTTVVNFSSTADITTEALSGRYSKEETP